MIAGKSILITGGTGTFGHAFVKHALAELELKRLVIFSRDEAKQHAMAHHFNADEASPLRFFLGDVRDRARLRRAFAGIDYVIHAAALKHVASGEYNPTEVVQTNIDGTSNVVEAAIDTGVARSVFLSSDKACAPVNLYGATKLVGEKLFRAANAYAGNYESFCVVRYGNVAGSRGSVIPLWRETEIPNITDPDATRFWMTPQQAVKLVLYALEGAEPGDLVVPYLPAYRLGDLAQAMAKRSWKLVGMGQGEKLHEMMIGPNEIADFGIVHNAPYWSSPRRADQGTEIRPVCSNTTERMTIVELRAALAALEPE